MQKRRHTRRSVTMEDCRSPEIELVEFKKVKGESMHHGCVGSFGIPPEPEDPFALCWYCGSDFYPAKEAVNAVVFQCGHAPSCANCVTKCLASGRCPVKGCGRVPR